MKQKGKVDLVLGVAVFLLIIAGPLMVYSASTIFAQNLKVPQPPDFFFKKQMYWALLAIIAILVTSRLSVRYFNRPKLIAAINVLSFILLLTVLLAGKEIKGAHRWFNLGFANFQVSELTKLAVIMFFAHWLSSRDMTAGRYRETALPMFMVLGGSMLLIMVQPDLGTALLLGTIAMSMVFVSRFKLRHLLATVLPAIPVVIIYLGLRPYQLQRIQNWFKGLSDPLAASYQVRQSIVAIGSGGFSGLGFGESRQKLLFLPDAHTDFIFSIIAEEMGLIGATIILGVFMLILFRGLRIARKAPDAYSRFLAFGLTLNIVLYAFMNIAVVSGLVPATGIPMPFISYGGSHMLFMGVSVGILLALSRTVAVEPGGGRVTDKTGSRRHDLLTQSLVR
ncbi:MAG TPA: putative lipid II flippase FtsW [Caldithrix abyssi]|uniref:Probable peptidoglycan glycosyltransferase FtsW n=1 Tax=Caldithrix abyssi TaxID=187145 RepID=A0A7V5RPI8_CALAY|nr:putative lipid II flippase FtsW [Caldithrix abyssi]